MDTTVTTITISSSSDGGFTTFATSHGTTTGLGVECAYNLNATGGATTITCTFSASAPISQDCTFVEFTSTNAAGAFTVDTSAGGAGSDAACTTACAAVAYTLSTSNNYIFVQSGSPANSLSAINQSYNFSLTFNSNGFAYKANQTTAGTTPNWTQTSSGLLAIGAIAIYENPGATKNNLTTTGAGT